jgi:hypothetical protein
MPSAIPGVGFALTTAGAAPVSGGFAAFAFALGRIAMPSPLMADLGAPRFPPSAHENNVVLLGPESPHQPLEIRGFERQALSLSFRRPLG